MFICEKCQKSATNPNILVLTTREKEYETKQGKELVTSKGSEIVQEIKLCDSCAGVDRPVYLKQVPVSNCNNCGVGTRCTVSKEQKNNTNCPHFKPVKGSFKLFELAIAYPTSLNETFITLPNIDFKLKDMK
jgi:hypothetical protein